MNHKPSLDCLSAVQNVCKNLLFYTPYRYLVSVCSSLSSALWDTYELYIQELNVGAAIVTSVAACQAICISIGPECGSFDYFTDTYRNCFCNGATFSQVNETVPQNLISSQTWRLYSRQCVAL